ncbi:hypothetical protein BJ165DRAFT_1355639 [Panaeolus papilionaceus]|nr:hypothetical protein BJ165DRAFT_1355639 [Panaeolus papilionaceus]
MKANIISFKTPIPKMYSVLPPPQEDMDEVLAVLFTGPCKPTSADLLRTPVFVRRNHVLNALEWLKLNHSDYADIDISAENLATYEDNRPPVSIEYRQTDVNNVLEGTSVFDNETEDGTETGPCSYSVHALTGDSLETMLPCQIKAAAIRHLDAGGRMLAVGHAKEPESIWNNEQLYPQMFPWLFPYGLGGLGLGTLTDTLHKHHLLMYHDLRFQLDIDFPFVAFSHEQIKSSTGRSFLLVNQSQFQDMSAPL